MQNPRLASRYVKSLLDLAVEKNILEAVLADMQLIDKTCRESRDFENMLRSPVITGDKKMHIIDAIFGDRIGHATRIFVKLLITKGREANLPEIASTFIVQYKVLKNIKTLRLTTASAVSEGVKSNILAKAKASIGNATIDLTTHIDPSLIGGFVLEMEDKLFDASVKRELNNVKSRFLDYTYVAKV